MLLLWVLICSQADGVNGDWAATIDKAGMQRTLSQMMSKEFLLISRGTKVAEYKGKLAESMSSFNDTLYALKTGDASQGILAPPNQHVRDALEEVLTVWQSMEQLLRENVDTVRQPDGKVDMLVLEALSSRNVPLLDTSDAVVKALVDAAQVAGASTNGLVADIAGRQRTLIQRLQKGILLLSQGVSMSFNMKAFRDTKSLFEASHDGIIRGVPFVGLPVLRRVCTLHQMCEVSFYYQKLRPLLTGMTNAETPSASQAAADEVAEEVVEGAEPLFAAMAQAVELYRRDEGACDPSAGSDAEWHAFITTLAMQRLLTQRVAQYFTQVALDVDVKSSQVEITVLLSQASGNLRDLIEGNKLKGIPAPPSQAVVDMLLLVDSTWQTFEGEVEAAVHLETVSDIILARVEQLGRRCLELLEEVMHMVTAMVTSSVPAHVLELSFEQALLASEVAQDAVLVHFARDVDASWENLNTSRLAFASNHWQLLQGAEDMQQVTDVCIVQDVKLATDLYSEFEVAALAVAHGDAMSLNELIRLTPLAVTALQRAAVSLSTGNASCGNQSLAVEQWIQLHGQASELGRLGEEIATESILLSQGARQNQESVNRLLQELDFFVRNLMFGSWQPPVAAPATQVKFDYMLSSLEPAVRRLKPVSRTGDVAQVLQEVKDLLVASEALQDEYLAGIMASNAAYPARRVHAALQQRQVAQEVVKEAILFHYDLRSSDAELQNAVARFEVRHLRLRDGGAEIPEIMMPEREDLMQQWERVDDAWRKVQAKLLEPSALRMAMDELDLQLLRIIPLYAVIDVKAPDRFPWSMLVYSTIAAVITSCCCCMVLVPLARQRAHKTAVTTSKPAGDEA